MRKLAIASAVLALGTFAAESQAIQIYLSTSNALTGANTDQAATIPTLTLTSVNQTGVLYVWARATNVDFVSGLGLSLNASNAAPTTTTDYTINNPTYSPPTKTRWNNPVSPGTLGDSFLNSNAVAVSGFPQPQGLFDGGGGDPLYNATTSSYLIGTITFRADAPGLTNLNFAVGSALISGNNTAAITFGPATDLQTVNGNVVGATTTTPDGIVNVVIPEPTSMALLGLGGLATLRRRRA